MAYLVKFNKNGNSKLGTTMWGLPKLAGDGIFKGVKGTCSQYCDGCYDPADPKKSPCYVFKSYVYRGWENSTIVAGHIRNTLGIRNDLDGSFNDMALQISRAKNKPSAIRIHPSGELESADELRYWIGLARKFPNIPIYIYTKAYDLVDEVLGSISVLPDNFYLNISIWHEHGISCYARWKYLDNVRAFIYCDNFDYLACGLKIDAMCPTYDKTGHKKKDAITCDACGICFSKRYKVCGCYNH